MKLFTTGLVLLGLAPGGCAGSIDPLDDFFSLNEVHTIEITVDRQGYEALKQEPRVYTPADVRIDGTLCENVGLRLKGAAGSFIPLDGERPWSGDGNGKPGKSAFVIDFNRFVPGRTYLGLKKLTLNNMVQDPSSVHEFLGYALFREAGVPASRSGFALVHLNGDPKYLYAVVEPPDNDEFLRRWFGTEEGDLFEGEYGGDFRADGVLWLDHDHGADVLRQSLRRVVASLDAIGENDDPMEILDRHFDMDEYLAFASSEIFLGHWDGYARSANNYIVHHHPGDDRWRFLPWGIDQVFVDHLGMFGGVMDGRGPAWAGGGRVHQLCFRSPLCMERLHAAFTRLFERIASMNLIDLFARARDLTAPHSLAESERYGDPGRTVEALDAIPAFVEFRRGELERWLGCLVGAVVDHDGDGYDDCTVDCRHENPEIHPGAPELCNFQDDDCNCVVDDPAGCPPCMEVPAEAGAYLICFAASGWDDALAACRSAGGDLASFSLPDLAFDLALQAFERGCSESLWIGLRREPGGAYSWSDGSPVGELPLVPREPESEGEDRDCVAITRHGWQPLPCSESHIYACKLPT